jgi:hypothetical protein
LESYKEANEAVAKAASKSLSGHLWYLKEILVGFALFDNEVSAEIKSAMVAAFDKKQQIILLVVSPSLQPYIKVSFLILYHNRQGSFSQLWIYHKIF